MFLGSYKNTFPNYSYSTKDIKYTSAPPLEVIFNSSKSITLFFFLQMLTQNGCLPTISFTSETSPSAVTAVLKLHNKYVGDKLPLSDDTEYLFLNDDNVICVSPESIVGKAQGVRERLIQRFM